MGLLGGSTVVRRSLSATLVTLVVAGAFAGRAAAQSVDDLERGLRAADWQSRHRTLQRMNAAYADRLPPVLRDAVVDLLARDAAHPGPPGEGYGEYVIDLVAAGLKTGDPRAARSIVAVGGLGVSPGVARFVASQGPGILGLVDSVARVDSVGNASAVYASMLSEHGALLSAQDSARVLLALVSFGRPGSRAALLGLAWDARTYGITALYPRMEMLAATDTTVDYQGVNLVQIEAARSASALEPLWRAVPPGTRLHQARLVVEEVCRDAALASTGRCTETLAHLATAERQLAAGLDRPAAEALRSSRLAIAAMASGPLDSALAASLITWIRAVERELRVALPQER